MCTTRRRRSDAITVAAVGMPNTGKATLYNRLTGGNAQIANWPGLTVELLRGTMSADRRGRAYQLVDLPGIHDLSGSSDDEVVVQRVLRHTPPHLLQLKALAVPIVVALNMGDEARRVGIIIDATGLGEALGLPVLAVSALRNQGIHELIHRVHLLAEIPQERVDVLLAQHVQLPPRLLNRRTRQADRLLLHQLVGLLLFLGIVLALFPLQPQRAASPGEQASPAATGLHERGGASWHQQQQAVALRVQHPGLGTQRFLSGRIRHGGAQLQSPADPGVEHREGARSLNLAFQTQRQTPLLPRSGPALQWGIHLQPAPGRPGQPPVAGAQAWLRLHLQQGAIEASHSVPRLPPGLAGRHSMAAVAEGVAVGAAAAAELVNAGRELEWLGSWDRGSGLRQG